MGMYVDMVISDMAFERHLKALAETKAKEKALKATEKPVAKVVAR